MLRADRRELRHREQPANAACPSHCAAQVQAPRIAEKRQIQAVPLLNYHIAIINITDLIREPPSAKLPQELSQRPGNPRALLKALEAFTGDTEALREHVEDIARERQRQRAAAQQQDAE